MACGTAGYACRAGRRRLCNGNFGRASGLLASCAADLGVFQAMGLHGGCMVFCAVPSLCEKRGAAAVHCIKLLVALLHAAVSACGCQWACVPERSELGQPGKCTG